MPYIRWCHHDPNGCSRLAHSSSVSSSASIPYIRWGHRLTATLMGVRDDVMTGNHYKVQKDYKQLFFSQTKNSVVNYFFYSALVCFFLWRSSLIYFIQSKKKLKNRTPQKEKITVKSCIEATLDYKPHSNNSHTFSKLKLHKRGTRTKATAWKFAAFSQLFRMPKCLFTFASILLHSQCKVALSLYIKHAPDSEHCISAALK